MTQRNNSIDALEVQSCHLGRSGRSGRSIDPVSGAFRLGFPPPRLSHYRYPRCLFARACYHAPDRPQRVRMGDGGQRGEELTMRHPSTRAERRILAHSPRHRPYRKPRYRDTLTLINRVCRALRVTLTHTHTHTYTFEVTA